MDFLYTEDSTCIIVYQQTQAVIYFNINSDESWLIYGECSHNGSCVEGDVNPDLRPVTERLDNPVRPEIECDGCQLRGVYL